MKKKGRIFVIDGNHALHRVWFTLRTGRPIEEALPYAFTSLICKDAVAVKATHMLVAFDGKQVFRYGVYDGYKADRKNKKQSGPAVDSQYTKPTGDVYDYLPDVYSMLSDARITYFQPKKHEADDVLASVGHQYSDEYQVVLGAQDKDDYQCLKGKHVLMYDSAHKNKESKPDPIYITEADLMEREGLTPAQFLQYQILLGDKIDSIPRIGTFKPLQIKKGLIEHGTIADWYAAADADVKKMFDMNRVAIKRNRKLVTLKTDVLPPTEPDEWKPPKAKSFEAQSLPSTYHAWHSQLYPKSRGLF